MIRNPVFGTTTVTTPTPFSYRSLMLRHRLHHHASLTPRLDRRGAVLVWFVMIVPLMLLILVGLTDYAGMSLARIELQNAVDAAALSAIKSWSHAEPSAAATEAATLFAANPVIGQTLGGHDTGQAVATVLTQQTSDDPAVVIDGALFGIWVDQHGTLLFRPSADQPADSASASTPATPMVLFRKTIQVHGITRGWLGGTLGPYVTSAEAYARLDPVTGRPQLVNIEGWAE
jgi:Flp pilus assembly protein TadG